MGKHSLIFRLMVNAVYSLDAIFSSEIVGHKSVPFDRILHGRCCWGFGAKTSDMRFLTAKWIHDARCHRLYLVIFTAIYRYTAIHVRETTRFTIWNVVTSFTNSEPARWKWDIESEIHIWALHKETPMPQELPKYLQNITLRQLLKSEIFIRL